MNHPLSILSGLILLAGPLPAELLYEESFSKMRFPIVEDGLRNYGGFGPTSGADAAAADVPANSLTFVDSAGHALATSGKHLLVDTDEETATISQVYTLPQAWPVTAQTIWISFLAKQTAGTNARFFNLALRAPDDTMLPADAGTAVDEVLAMGMPSLATPQTWRLWNRTGTAAGVDAAITPVLTDTQVLVLARLEANYNGTSNERYTVWTNPRLDVAPDEAAGVSFTSSTSDVPGWSSITELRLGAGFTNANGPASAFEIDEIRVATTKAEVTPYVTMAVTEVILGANGATTISWTAAPGVEDTVQWSTNLIDWESYPTSTRVHPAGAEIATWTTPVSAQSKLFLRVVRTVP